MQIYRISPSFSGHIRGPSAVSGVAGGSKTVGRWLKDSREKKREETRAQNAQLHAAVSVASVAAAVAAIAVATASQSSSGNDEQVAQTDSAVASAATLVAAQCVEAAQIMGADREHLASVVSSAVNVRSAGDIMTLTAAAATGRVLILIILVDHENIREILYYRSGLLPNTFETFVWAPFCRLPLKKKTYIY
ncbi:hypothetical protein F2Q68_00010659 [Brassica cretica]|uniref:VAN3-binding protein-like auxin canalisation domain-containing protein n=1 Tax=Brassica cretica TaxID=69181 RepID=A0A8S9L023_BRACR|nr:hypothetical protein F2Q68_00010659 [Brassica cretica]